jgi:hypothetical protein
MDASLIVNRFEQLYSERKTLDDTLQLVERFVMPYRSEFFRDLGSEQQVNWRRRSIYDGTAVNDCEQLASAISSNVAPAAMKWFNLTFRNSEINEDQAAREWLDECEEILWKTLLESDFHQEFNKSVLDICGFGTNTLLMEEVDDLEWKGIDYTATPLMDAYYELDASDKVSRMYYVKRWTSLQAIEKFPKSEEALKTLTKDDPVDKKKDYILCIYYREDHESIDTSKPLNPELRPVGYKWVCKESSTTLKEGGYYFMPAMRNIWKATAGSKYGHSPAMIALSDIMQLNEFVAQLSEASAKALDPAMWTTNRGFIGDVDLEAGGITDVTDKDEFGLMPEGTNFAASNVELDRLQQAIHRHFKIDMLDLKESPAMTATEVMERRDRQREQFGPTVGGIEGSVLESVVENTFLTLARQQQFPQAPDSVGDSELDIEYTGKLSRLMRSAEADATTIWVQEGMGMAQVNPDVLDNYDFDAIVVGTGEARGIPAKYRRDEDTIAEIRAARAEAQKKQAEMEQAQLAGRAVKDMASGAKDLGGIDMENMGAGNGVQQ